MNETLVLKRELRFRHFFVPLVVLENALSRLVNSGVLIGEERGCETSVPVPFEPTLLTRTYIHPLHLYL